ncbi:MAG: transferrin-binding protein-like solute binding protein [Novosphingobium sp.]
MKSLRLKTLAIALFASASFAGTAHAGVEGASSDTGKVTIATSNLNAGPHVAGRPGIGVPAMPGVIVDFQGLQSSVGTDGNGVSTINSGTSTPSDHSNLGVFHFAKVGSANLYFGEWSQTSSVGDGTHTVYYAGDDGGTTTIPTSGSATYSVKGVSDYANKGLLTGTFTASFGSGTSGTLTGSLANSGSGYAVNIGTATIAGANFASTGATATQSGSTVASSGVVTGRFFGADAAALAGIVNFSGARQYNTAFGGTKN